MPDRTDGQKIAEAIDLVETAFPGEYWLFSKGKMATGEPLYAVSVHIAGDPEAAIITEAEHDDPLECARLAVAQMRVS